jgi:hypothetical protein
MKSIYFRAIVILVITFFFPHSSGAQLRQTTPSETMIKIPESSIRPRFTLVIPAKSRLLAGGTPVVATLQGNGLDRMTAVQILQNNSPVQAIEAKLGSPGKTVRAVTVSAKSIATPGTYKIKGISTNSGGSMLFILLEVVLESARADAQSQSALIEIFEEMKSISKDAEIEAKKDKLGRSQPTQVPVAPGPLQTALLPDLVVSKVTFTPANPTTVDRITVNVEIKNQGNAAAVMPAGATIWLATKPTGGGVGAESKGETIKPGLSFSRSLHLFNAGELKPGTYQIKVTVDPENRVKESNETNNQLVCTLTVFDNRGVLGWRIPHQEAIALARELRNYDRIRELATKIEAELQSSEKTMFIAEQLKNKKQINREEAKTAKDKLSEQIKVIENLMEEVKNKRQEYQTAFENFDQKANQLFNILSTVLKNMKETENSITRNIN